MREESCKTFVGMPGEIVDAEPTETGPDTAQSVFVDKRQIIGCIVHGGEIVAHTETGPVARDFFIPFRSEARQTAAIGSNDDVVVSSHYLEIPTVAPKLTHGTLRSALTEEQCRIFLRGIEMRWQNDPNEFLLAIDGRHPTLLHFSDFKLIEDMFVLIGDLAHIGFLFFLRGSNDEKVVGMRETMACGKQFASIAQELERAIIVPTVGELHHAAGEVGLIHIDATVPNADKIERLRVGGPAVVVYIGVEGLADVTFLARSEGINTEPVAVALVAIVLHALPGDVSSVGREFGVLVVANILIFLLMVDGLVFETLSSIYGRLTIVGRLAEIHRFPRGRSVEEDVRVGGDRIGPTGFLATGIGDGFRVGTPSQLFHTAEGSHGAFVGLTLENVTSVVNAFGGNIG